MRVLVRLAVLLVLVSHPVMAAEPLLKQSLANFGAASKSGITLKDLEVMRIDLTAKAGKSGTVSDAVADELAAIGAVQDLWDVIIHGWTCRNFTAHEAACIATVHVSMEALGLALDEHATPETMLRDALALLVAKNEKSLAALAAK